MRCTKLRLMRSFALGCMLLLALAAGTARASLFSGFTGLDSMKESLVVAASELEAELHKAQATFQDDLAKSRDFSQLNETARELEQTFFSKNVDVPVDAEDLSPELKRVLLNGNGPMNGLSKMGKFIPNEFQTPRYRPIKKLEFFKRYTFAAGCSLRVKLFGDTPTGDRLFSLNCGKPRLTSAFCYRWPIDIPIGALTFPFEFPVCLPDLSGFEDVLKILNGDLGAVVSLLGL